jgi:hypothetical protein
MCNEFGRREFERDRDFDRRRRRFREHRHFHEHHHFHHRRFNRYSHRYWDNFYDDVLYD